jgi:hypothetical protein
MGLFDGVKIESVATPAGGNLRFEGFEQTAIGEARVLERYVRVLGVAFSAGLHRKPPVAASKMEAAVGVKGRGLGAGFAAWLRCRDDPANIESMVGEQIVAGCLHAFDDDDHEGSESVVNCGVLIRSPAVQTVNIAAAAGAEAPDQRRFGECDCHGGQLDCTFAGRLGSWPAPWTNM